MEAFNSRKRTPIIHSGDLSKKFFIELEADIIKQELISQTYNRNKVYFWSTLYWNTTLSTMYQSTQIATSSEFYFVTSGHERCAVISWGLRELASFKGYKNLKAPCDHLQFICYMHCNVGRFTWKLFSYNNTKTTRHSPFPQSYRMLLFPRFSLIGEILNNCT